jgi:hypothetical protein
MFQKAGPGDAPAEAKAKASADAEAAMFASAPGGPSSADMKTISVESKEDAKPEAAAARTRLTEKGQPVTGFARGL